MLKTTPESKNYYANCKTIFEIYFYQIFQKSVFAQSEKKNTSYIF